MAFEDLCRDLFDAVRPISMFDNLLDPIAGTDLGDGYRHLFWLGSEEQFEGALTGRLNEMLENYLALASKRDWKTQGGWLNDLVGQAIGRATTDRPMYIWTTPVWRILPKSKSAVQPDSSAAAVDGARPSSRDAQQVPDSASSWRVQDDRPAETVFLGPCHAPIPVCHSLGTHGRIQIPVSKLNFPRRKGIPDHAFVQQRHRTVVEGDGQIVMRLAEQRLAIGHPQEDAGVIASGQLPLQREYFRQSRNGKPAYLDCISVDIGKVYSTTDDLSTALVLRESIAFDREANFLSVEESSWSLETLSQLHPEFVALLTEAIAKLRRKLKGRTWPNHPPPIR